MASLQKKLQSDPFLKSLFRISMLDKQCDDRGWFRMHNTVIDEGVYGRRRYFRLPCNAKIRKSVYLKVIDEDSDLNVLVSESACSSQVSLGRFRRLCLRKFENMLVFRVDEVPSLTYICAGNDPYDVQATKTYVESGFNMEKDFSVLNVKNVCKDLRIHSDLPIYSLNKAQKKLKQKILNDVNRVVDYSALSVVFENKKVYGPDGVLRQLK